MPIDFDEQRSEQILHVACTICQANNKLAKDNFTRLARFVNDWIHEERELRMNEEVNMRQRITDLEQTLRRLKNLL